MELNKFESQIKDKLEGRKIEPSTKSWDRLDAMLSVEEKPKKKSFLWYYVAASLFFVFGITYWFINQNPTEIVTPQNTIVTTEGEDSLELQEEKIIENKVETNGDLIEDIRKNQNSVIVQNNVGKETKRQIENKQITPKNEVVALNKNNKIQIRENNKPQTANRKPTYVSAKKLLASVENNNENSSITNKKNQKNTVKVDANSLLSTVESEITEEYRETTFDKLKRKFDQAKTAVANRNYE